MATVDSRFIIAAGFWDNSFRYSEGVRDVGSGEMVQLKGGGQVIESQ